MKRRTLIAGIGSLTAGSVFAVGSGAFTSVQASRTVTVETAGDNDALLRLQQLGSGYRSSETGTPEQVKFSFPGFQERLADPDLGLGVDSVYEFDRDADESDTSDSTTGLLRIGNRGTQPVVVYSKHESANDISIELFDVTDPDRAALRDDPIRLGTGDFVDVGFRIQTFDAEVGTFDETLTVVAEKPDQ
mgnify:CR=1 FL=1